MKGEIPGKCLWETLCHMESKLPPPQRRQDRKKLSTRASLFRFWRTKKFVEKNIFCILFWKWDRCIMQTADGMGMEMVEAKTGLHGNGGCDDDNNSGLVRCHRHATRPDRTPFSPRPILVLIAIASTIQCSNVFFPPLRRSGPIATSALTHIIYPTQNRMHTPRTHMQTCSQAWAAIEIFVV